MELVEIENRVAPVLRKYRVARAAIFGSYARGEERERIVT
jgi:predicted nucleotidyltransferase